ncbi:MAG: hypothetical protein L6Q99_09100 [Planctomycetes bacterium]|nr:hypothetical protein [Planctomycetota bacterium]
MQVTLLLRPIVSLFAVAAVLTGFARAQERFVYVPFDGLEFEGERPAPPGSLDWRRSWVQDVRAPYVVLDVPGEAYLDYVDAANAGTREWVTDVPALALRLTSDAPVTGRLWMPTRDWQGLTMHRFRVAQPDASPDPRARYFEAMEEHYARLDRRDLPGEAWFRHRAAWARRQRGAGGVESLDGVPTRAQALDATLELFSGAKAVAENLDLDRELRAFENEPLDVPIDSLEGVTTRAMDWKALVVGLEPELDPLAKSIPSDQHAVFFPSFAALTEVVDELDRSGTPLLEFFAADVQDARTKDRYQEQLCLPLSAVARLLGPTVVTSVALTGGDPFVRAGTDVTVLFECKQPAVLEGYLAARQAEAEKRGAWKNEGDLGGSRYKGVHTADRRVSSFVARFGDVLAVSNSVDSLRRVADALAGRTPSLASTDEYVWFRNRYERGEPGESAFLVLSDATIRRWAGPRARIGDSRRVRAAAAMAEIQCRHLGDLAAGRVGDGASAADSEFAVSADFLWSKDGVRSPTWGTMTFLTPLAELSLDKVSASEKRAYETFRETFQRRWSTVFDPIAIRLSFDAGKLAADVTIMPLTATTDYREFRQFAGDAKLAPHAGDPHPEALLHFATAFDAKSEFGNFLSGAVGGELGADPLAWLGDGIALYADRDPFWEELSKQGELERALSETFYRLPVALHCEVKDPLKLAAFMTGLRTIANQAAPDLTTWQTREFEGHTYVRVSVDEDVDWGEAVAEAAVYYATLPKALIVSLREDVLQRALKRYDARKAGAEEFVTGWLGKSTGLRVERGALDVLGTFGGESLEHEVARAAWSPIPILDEWKRLFPEQDALALHERFFGVRLVSPSGGTFRWDETAQTFASTDYGSPGAPTKGPGLPRAIEGFVRGEFGLEFEGEGLRARAELTRQR